jgi:hypothetical protein
MIVRRDASYRSLNHGGQRTRHLSAKLITNVSEKIDTDHSISMTLTAISSMTKVTSILLLMLAILTIIWLG